MAKRKKVRVGRIICIIVTAALFVYCTNILSAKISEKNDLLKEQATYQLQKEKLEQQKQELTEQKEKLSDENYIDNIKRSKYFITKEGEQVFKLPSQDD